MPGTLVEGAVAAASPPLGLHQLASHKVQDLHPAALWTAMSTRRHAPSEIRSHTTAGHPARSAGHGAPIAWAPVCRLGAVLSVGAAALAIGLHGLLADQAIVTTVIVGASAVAWSRVEPLRPSRVPTSRR